MLKTRLALLTLVALVATLSPACGKKGPPLAPLIRLPAAADSLTARRLGDAVYLELAIPGRNLDNSTPADISRVDVYGFTGIPENDDDLLKRGTLVARIPVRKPPEEDETPAPRDTDKAKAGEPGKPPAKPAPSSSRRQDVQPGFDQGAMVTVSETLTPALLQPLPSLPPKPGAEKPAIKPAAGAKAPAVPPTPRRVYIAVGFSEKGRRGAASRRAAVPVATPPAAPTDLKLTYNETQITLTWTPSEPPPPPPPTPVAPVDAAQPQVQPQAAQPQMQAAAQANPPAPAALRYNVYAVAPGKGEPGKAAAPAAPGTVSAPKPSNAAPLDAATFTDPSLQFGSERCYEVRAVAAVGDLQEESAASTVACVTPVDKFPPAAPKGLTAVTSTGAINLLWEPNTESDLAGYLVLRGEAPGVKLQPITKEPIRETTFNDTTAKAGVRYVYAVVAVDKTGNIGAQSNPVEETGR